MDTIQSIFEGVEEEEVQTPKRMSKVRVFNPSSETYLSPVGHIKKSTATEDIPQAVEMEVVRGTDDDLCESEVFRRSSRLSRTPPGPADPMVKKGSLPNMGELEPVVVMERIPPPSRPRRESTPLELSRATEGEESVAIIGDLTLTQEGLGEGDEGEASGASSIVFAPSRTHKRGRGVFSESATSASATGDEESVAVSEEKPKRKRKPGRPRTTNVIDQIMARREEREREQTQEREEWERRRMEDPNLVVPPAASLPPIEDIVEEMRG